MHEDTHAVEDAADVEETVEEDVDNVGGDLNDLFRLPLPLPLPLQHP